MSNKKRISKLYRKKYKANRKFKIFETHILGWDFGHLHKSTSVKINIPIKGQNNHLSDALRYSAINLKLQKATD